MVAVQNPLTSLADDVKATKRALAMQNGPTVLVGHSYGGTASARSEWIRRSLDLFTWRLWLPNLAKMSVHPVN